MTQCRCCNKNINEKNICNDCVTKINSLLTTDKQLVKYNIVFAIATFGSFLCLFFISILITTIYIALENDFSSLVDVFLMFLFFLFVILLLSCLLCRILFKFKIKKRIKSIL